MRQSRVVPPIASSIASSIIVCCAIAGCGSSNAQLGGDAAERAPTDAATDGGVGGGAARAFTDVTQQAGLDLSPGATQVPPACVFDNAATPNQDGDFCFPEQFAGAAAAGDYDGDGWVDLFLTRRDGPDRLLRNQGDGTFVELAAEAGIVGHAGASGGAVFVDIDNDGDLDLVVTSIGGMRHYLYVNDGSGHFAEQALARGVAVATAARHIGTHIAVGDYDLDGYLDLFVGEWRPDGALGDSANHNRLLHNRGAAMPGYFDDVTADKGIDVATLAAQVDAKPGVYVFAPAFVDLDGDRYPDLTLAADFGTSRLYWNDGAGGFVDGTAAAGVGSERNGMGSTFGDVDGDGDLDWFVSAVWTDDIADLGHRLYRYDGARGFTERSDAHGIRRAGWGWGTTLFDYDLDGDLDLALAAGWPGFGYDDDPFRLWENTGDGLWPERAAELGIVADGFGRGLLCFDYDNDGDLDLLVANNDRPPQLLRNDGGTGSWLRVTAHGLTSNASGIGAVVTVRATPSAAPQVRHIGVGSHFFGQSPAEAHFGLGAGDAPLHEVIIDWPASEQRQVYRDVARNQLITATEPMLGTSLSRLSGQQRPRSPAP